MSEVLIPLAYVFNVTTDYLLGVNKKQVLDVSELTPSQIEAINKLIEEFNINEVAFEDIQLQENVTNNVQTFKVLAEVFGVIYELVTELKIPNSATLASVWKSALNIKGRTRPEQKRNAQQYVLDTYGIKATQDECDAICIGTYIVNEKAREKIHDWSD